MNPLFEALINDLRIYLKNRNDILKDFIVLKPIRNYARIMDHLGKIGNDKAHYEIKLYHGKITVEIHFEEGSGKSYKKDKFSLNLENRPYEKIKWVDWYDSKSIQYDDGQVLYLGSPNILYKISEGLLHFEDSGLAGDIRKLLLMISIPLKE